MHARQFLIGWRLTRTKYTWDKFTALNFGVSEDAREQSLATVGN